MHILKPRFKLVESNLLGREWLVTNGIGGYGSGTVGNVLTRSYHGLLVSARKPPLGRTVQLVKLDETARAGGAAYPLFDNRWQEASAPLEPGGMKHLVDFYLEGAIPVWVYGFDGRRLQKRVWMQPGENTTYIRYEYSAGEGALDLDVKALVNDRSFHQLIAGDGREFEIERLGDGLAVRPPGAAPYYLLCAGGGVVPACSWHRNYFHAVEAYRGLDARGDNLRAGGWLLHLEPGESATLVASTRPDPNLDGSSALEERRRYEAELLRIANVQGRDERVQHLILAADQFIVRRSPRAEKGGREEEADALDDGRTVIAGYHWFGDWGRDTMIALPGLTLPTGRPQVARRILNTFAGYVDAGMLPNRFPDEGQAPEYNTVDATLWFFEATRAYHAATGDLPFVRDLYPKLADIIAWHLRGTRYGIHMDPVDHLLLSGEPGVQLTWMDAKVGDWVVTPRMGKPVEINALWYNALRIMGGFSERLELPAGFYRSLADEVAASFVKFWNPERKALYDILDIPAGGADPSLRPNQLFAVSLPHSPLSARRQKAVVDACMGSLLTPHGLRSLAPDEPAYQGAYGGDQVSRDSAYHQGTVWGWLIGPLVSAHYRVYRDRAAARALLEPLLDHLTEHGVGSISEIFDGDPPFAPRGCVAQAWSVSEVLRNWMLLSGDEV